MFWGSQWNSNDPSGEAAILQGFYGAAGGSSWLNSVTQYCQGVGSGSLVCTGVAARKLQLKEVPVIVLDHLTETQKRAYILADNQLALNAGWDESLLRAELAALQEEDFNLNVIGFEDEELARLLAAQDAAEGLTDEDAVPELSETPISVAGDLWMLSLIRQGWNGE